MRSSRSQRSAGARLPRRGREVSDEILACAEEAGLRYVNDDQPGVSREQAGKRWRYRLPGGGLVRDNREIARIERLAIPPAWTNVWICPHANGHIQATGRDQRGRKQYRYHADWRATRDATKYERMVEFGRALPRIRRRVAADLRQRGLGREKVLAAVVRLLETTFIRVGNEEYARDNRSYGLTTLRNRHVRVRGGRMHFEFTGKSGKRHEIDLHDARLAAIVQRVQDLPGQELFGYVDADGQAVDVKSDDVNVYLREAAGAEFSAKDFRTWAGTVMAAMFLAAAARSDGHKPTKKNLTSVVKDVSDRLGNTPAVCRKCYIHPLVLDSYLAGEAVEVAKADPSAMPRAEYGLSAAEEAVLAFLETKAREPKLTLAEQLRHSVNRTSRTSRSRSAKRSRQTRTSRFGDRARSSNARSANARSAA